jgi:hypothetical protein
MDFDIVRKSFEVNIRIKKRYRNKIINVKYEQASMYEITEFLYEVQEEWFQISNRILDFVINHTKEKLSKLEKRIVIIKSPELFDTLQKTYFKWSFGEIKEWQIQANTSNDMISSYIVFLSSELKQDPLYLMKNYSIEQLKFFTDWVAWNMNERTPEGQKKNRLKAMEKRWKNVSSDWVKDLLSKITENKCNEASK